MNAFKKPLPPTRSRAIAALLFVWIFSSCAPVYRPNTLFMPVFEQQGDVSIEASLGSSDITLNAGYAFSDNLAIIGGGQIKSLSPKYSVNSYFFEGGMGYYKKPSDSHSFEILGGMGYGNVEFDERYRVIFGGGYRNRHMESNYARFFLQYNIHFNVRPMIFSFSSRFSQLHVFHYENIISSESDGRIVDETSRTNFGSFFLEPNVTVTLKLGELHLFVQSGASLHTSGPATIMDHEFYMLNIGVKYNFNRGHKP